MRVPLAIGISVWTLAAWGGRIGLLSSGEGWGAWLRIGGSILIGLFAAATLIFPKLESVRRPTLVVFAVFTVILWTRSLVVNWTGDGSMAFKIVHTVLAVGFFALAAWAVALAVSPSTESGAEAAHSQSGAKT
jgi:hypothetical protein